MVVRSETPRRCAGDEGSALVEAAFITPVLLYLLLGILEAGLLFRTYMTLATSTQDGARTAAILGNDLGTDYEVIQDVKKSMSAIPTDQIQNLVIFKATGTPAAASVAPSACTGVTTRTQSTASLCNTYVPATDWNTTAADKPKYNCDPVGTGWSKGYCPTDRKVALTGVKSPPDYLGVYIGVQHKYASKLFGSTKLLTETTITRLEPQSLSS